MAAEQLGRAFLDESLGRVHRDDPVVPGSGGPAGNARLTAWSGLVLLVLFAAELLTLIDVHDEIAWHIVIGVILVPPALLKTASTGWRIVRYYTGNRYYRQAGPPNLVLRVVGPFVVLGTLAVLGTGLVLIFVTPVQAREDGAFGMSLLNLHKAAFIVWLFATGIHVIGRLVPALALSVGNRAPGTYWRVSIIALVTAVAVLAGALAMSRVGPWQTEIPFRPGHRAVTH